LLPKRELPANELLCPNPLELFHLLPPTLVRDDRPAFPKWEAPKFLPDRFPPASDVFVMPRLPTPELPVALDRSGVVRALGGRSDWNPFGPAR
jgi:hypothetical protein